MRISFPLYRLSVHDHYYYFIVMFLFPSMQSNFFRSLAYNMTDSYLKDGVILTPFITRFVRFNDFKIRVHRFGGRE